MLITMVCKIIPTVSAYPPGTELKALNELSW